MAHKYIQTQFALPDNDRGIFSSDTEAASIFCLVEERRKKKGFLSSGEEKNTALLQTNYPVYAIKWRDRCILFDGLGTISENVTHRDIIDLNKFEKDLSNISKVGQLREFLTKNTKTFNQFTGNRKMKINNIISNHVLLSEITDFIKKSSLKTPTKDTAVIFRVDNQVIQQTVSEFENLMKQVEQEIESLEKVNKILRSSTDKAIQEIQNDKNKDIEIFNQEWSKLKPIIDEKINEIQKKQSEEIQNINDVLNKEIDVLKEEKQKYEKEIRKRTRLEEETISEKKTLSQHGDLVGEQYWNKEALRNKDIIADVFTLIKTDVDSIEKIQFRYDATLKRLREKFEDQIEKAQDQLNNIESKHNASIDMKDLIINEFEHRYALISAQISDQCESKLKDKEKLIEMTTSWNPNENCVILVPLYLAKNEMMDKTRYDVFAPSIVKSYTTFKKSKRVFAGLETKISNLLSPIGQEYSEFFTKNFRDLMTNNKKFEDAIIEVSEKTNLFKKSDRGKLFSDGFNCLKKEGWLDNQEYKRMLVGLNLSFKLASSDNPDFAIIDPEENFSNK